jgi:hypothetical protein
VAQQDDTLESGVLVSVEREKTITLVSIVASDLPLTRRWLGAWAIAHDLKVLRFEEHRKRLSTDLKVTVAGHPADIREFHDDVRGDAWTADSDGDPIDWIITPIVVGGLRAAKRKWQARNDPPRGSSASRLDGPRTVVYWKWEEAGEDGAGFGPVWVDRYETGAIEPYESEEWPHWVKRADALAHAREHDFTFFPDE